MYLNTDGIFYDTLYENQWAYPYVMDIPMQSKPEHPRADVAGVSTATTQQVQKVVPEQTVAPVTAKKFSIPLLLLIAALAVVAFMFLK